MVLLGPTKQKPQGDVLNISFSKGRVQRARVAHAMLDVSRISKSAKPLSLAHLLVQRGAGATL